MVKDYAELARLGKVTRARISQILGLTKLASEIQEAVLSLPRVVCGRESIKLAAMLAIAKIDLWAQERKA